MLVYETKRDIREIIKSYTFKYIKVKLESCNVQLLINLTLFYCFPINVWRIDESNSIR